MKTIIIPFLILLNQLAISQNIIFNDVNFKNRLIENGVDTNNDGEISLSEASFITSLDVSYGWNSNPIIDLSGIEYFINIDTLDCSYNNFQSIDLSHNTKLTYLKCYSINVTSLDLSNNTLLKYLDCGGNNLSIFNLGANSNLEEIYLNEVFTSSIFNFQNLPNLKILEFNYATDLDLTHNQNLTTVSCQMSRGKINVSNNPDLKTLICQGQSNLDISNSPLLETLVCSGNDIKLDSIDLSKNIALKDLELWDNNLSTIDLSFNTALNLIELGYNHIPNIDFTNNIEVTQISCGGHNNLSSIKISGLVNLETLATGNINDSTRNNLTSLDVSTNIKLKFLRCPSGKLTNLNLSQNKLLEELYCGYNNFDTIILCSNPQFQFLDCEHIPTLTHVYILDTASPPNYYSFGSSNIQFYECNVLNTISQISSNNIYTFPNPASQILNINNLTDINNLTYEIFDVNSKIILKDNLNLNYIDINKIKSGIYFLIIKKNDSIFYQSDFIKE